MENYERIEELAKPYNDEILKKILRVLEEHNGEALVDWYQIDNGIGEGVLLDTVGGAASMMADEACDAALVEIEASIEGWLK